MTRDDIIRMAKEAHKDLVTVDYPGHAGQLDPWTLRLLERFAALVIAAEREACAKVCEAEQFELTQDVAGKNGLQHFDAGCRSCAEMIRARGEK